MSFDLFGQTTKCDIKVGYISTDRGYVDNIGLYEANVEAKLNPGTQFIFTNRDKVEYLNINEVNKLVPADLLPDKITANGGCSGIVGLNLEGDTSKSIDDAFNLTTPIVGGTTKEGASDARDKTAVDFYGGGGVGVQAAPIIGIDGSVLAVQVIHGGYGYQYPPIVDITDDTGQGSGVVAQAFIKTRSSDDAVLIEEFDAEEDYEEYDLETCAPEMIRENIGYGQRWDPDGKDLGKWDPNVYVSPTKNRVDPIRYEIEKYQKFLATLKDGVRIDGNRIKGWWTTRNRIPLRITSPDKVTREKFDVQHFAWGGLKSNSSPTLPLTSGGNSSKSTDFIESSFLVYTSGGQRRDLKFIFTSTVGNHSFVIKADDYKDNASAEEIKIKVARNVKYKVVTTSRKGIRDQGLLKKGTFGTGGDIAKRTGTSDAIFSDIAKTAPDDDDLQVRCKLGTFSINDGNIIFELKDNSAYNVLSVANKGVAVANSKDTKNSFMNQYAISPIPPSNVPGSDNAGKTYTFEWEEEFPYEGDYIFNIQCDNEARLFIGSDPISNDFHIGKGGAAGHVLSGPASIKRHMTAGIFKITLDLFNHQIKEMKKIQTDVVPTSDEVKFDVSISSLFANGITIEGLGIDVSKEYGEGKDIKETITKKVEYGRVYPVKMRSSGFKQETSPSTVVNFTGLNAANNPINVTNNGTRLALKDGDGTDTNASFVIINVTGGTAKFSADGKGIDVKGDSVQVTLNLSWNDRPRTAGTAVGSIKIGNKIWTQSGRSGSQSHTVTLSSSSSSSGNSSTIKLKTKGEKVITVEDLPGQAAGSAGVGFFDDIICSVNNGRFYGISGSSCNFIVDAPVGNKGGSNQSQKGERANVFNTIDYINKANRKLWKINSGVGKDASFINQFGVLPFDPTAVAKVEKKRSKTVEVSPTGAPPSVKFEVGDDGKTYLKVIGNGRVKVGLQLNVNDNPRRAGLAVREVKIQADDGEIFMKRDWVTRATDRGIGVFSAGKKYEVKILGGVGRQPIPNNAQDTIGLLDSHGTDWNADVKITSITQLSTNKQIEESYFGYPDYPNASTDDYAGFHEIIWDNITFPEDGNYAISTMVDDNVTLTFIKPNEKEIVIEKEGFRIRGDGRTGKGKSIEIKYFKAGTYTLKALLEQIPGAALANGNPMALAVDIKAAFLSDEIEVISSKSWNENPMGIAMTIDSPMAPKPKEPPQIQEGRCPNNPIWTTRSNKDTIATWYPVRTDAWSKFMNRYAISPLPPLGFKGTDGAGTVYRNTWLVELPYRGFYGVKGTVDNFGKLFIDGVEVLGSNADKNFDNFKNAAPKAKKIFLEKKTVKISVEVENDKQFIYNTIDKKVFSTADWASKQTQTETTVEGPKNVDVTFKVSSASLYANSITLFDGSLLSSPLFSDSKEYGGPNIKETHSHNIEVGKVYDVRLTSSSKRTVAGASGIEFTGLNAANNPINVTNNGKRLALKDGDGTDTNASFTIESGDVKFSADGKGLVGTGSVKFTLSWNDRPRTAGVAVQRIKIGTTTWTQSGRSGSETHTVQVGASSAGGNNNSNIQLRNKGKNVIQMEDWTDNDWADIICSATEGEFYDLRGRNCKFRVPPTSKTEIVYGKGLTSGSSKGGVSYSGPPLATYATGTLGPFITPSFNGDEDYIANFNGKTWTMTWSGVDFDETGTYDIQAEADDLLIIKIDGTEVSKAEVANGISKSQFNVTKGKRTVELTLTNIQLNLPFSSNPTVAAVKITKKVQVAKVDPRTGTAQGRPWTVNPLGVSAILIPPPCPKKINGVGIVTSVIITDPGNGFPADPTPPPGTPPAGPPVILELVEIIGEPGINYGPDDRVCVINTETGEEVCYVPPKDPTTGIPPFKPSETPLSEGDPGDPGTGDGPDRDPEDPDIVSDPGDPGQRKPPNGFRTYPEIRVRTGTGIGYKPIPILRPVVDPIGVEPDRLIQVTDLPGLKQTGYYDGKPYYGAVFYEDGVRFAGYYDTPGQKVQIYDTLQESIDAEVTTPPSAIQRQGTDINSNNPRLNIPGTPDNLT